MLLQNQQGFWCRNMFYVGKTLSLLATWHDNMQICIRKPITHQVRSNTSSNTEPNIHIDGVTAVLGNLSESRQCSRNGKGKHQNGFEQLGAIWDCWVEVHLEEERAAEVSSCHVQINNKLSYSYWQSDKRKVGSSNNLSPCLSLEVDPAKYLGMWSADL